MPNPLNLREHYWAYTYYHTTVSAQSVLSYASIDLSSEAPEMIGVQGSVLPYWAVHHYAGVHALTVYATNGSSTITEWDPLNVTWAGAQTISTSVAASAINSGNAGFVW